MHSMSAGFTSLRIAPPRTLISGTLLLVLLTGCAVGPEYERPEVATQTDYTVSSGELAPGWKLAEPIDPDRMQPWWQRFGDPRLDALVARLDVDNQTVAQAEARFRQAQAALRSSRAALYPTVGAEASYRRQQYGRSEGIDRGTGAKSYEATLALGWELDLWGRLRRQREASGALLEASAADLAGARLSARSTLVQSYLQLRVLDQQQRLYARTLEAYARSLELTENQYRAGLVARSDVVQAQSQLARTRAAAVDLEWQRAQLENAIAVLTGQPPEALAIEAETWQPPALEIPLSLPSQLLEQRPDIAAAERQVAAANAGIGVAQAAWFPTLSLSAVGGYQGGSYGDWFEVPNRFWSVGPSLALTLFDGGARRALKDEAIARYDETVAAYRQTVLNAFREVENALSRVAVLSREIEIQQRAVVLAEEAERLIVNQYRAGTVSFLDVATVQAESLAAQRTLLTLQGDRLLAGVQLMTALGGDWQRDQLESTAAR
jgi:NodT family efflux transporter outer membrane factor (OMF) lipoprotein